MTNKRTLTLRRAIVLVVVLGLLLPSFLIGGYSWFKRYNSGIRKQTQELLEQNAAILSNGMQEPLWNINQESGTALVQAMMSRNEDIVHIEVRDNALGIFVSDEHSERRGGYTLQTDKPIVYRGNTIGSVKVEVGSVRLRRLLIADLIESMFSIGAQALLSVALIMILLEYRLVRPLKRLGLGAESLANRELDKPFTWQRLDEIGRLSQRMEVTRLSLSRLFDEVDRKNKELEQDLEKRKRIEQELHEREARYRALVEQSPIAIIEWDTDYRVIEWNGAAERIFGYLRKHAIGRHASFILPPANRATLIERFQHLPAGTSDRHVTQNRKADASVITCQWVHTHIADATAQMNRLLSIAEDITEKRRTEEARILSEAKFAGAFQCNPDAVLIMQLSNGVLLDINQAAEKTTGFLREHAIGKTTLELNLWTNAKEQEALFAQLFDEKMVREFAWRMRTRHGTVRDCLTNGTVFSVGGEDYVLTVVRDITDQRMLEEQKVEVDRILLRLAQGTQNIAGESFFELLVDDLASALHVNHAFIGLKSHDSPGSLQSIAAYGDSPRMANFEYGNLDNLFTKTLEGEICIFPTGIQTRFPLDPKLVNGNWDSFAGAPLRDSAGDTIGILGVLHSQPLGNPDLVKTLLQVFSERASAELERKHAEEELRSSEQRFSTIFQSSPVAMFVVQVRGGYVIKDVNSAFEKLFVRSREGMLGQDTLRLGLYCDPSDRTALINELQETGTTNANREVWMYRNDTTRILVQFSGHGFTLAGEKYWILACLDITDKRQIESKIRELNATLEQRVIKRTEELQKANKELEYTLETLNKAQEELVRSEKLAALGSLVAGIAHELNTPIGNSLMVASTLADQTRLLEKNYMDGQGIKRSSLESFLQEAGQAGDIMVRNLQRAADLVISFKQVAVDQTSSQRRRFLLGEVVSEIMLTLSPTLKKTTFAVTQDIPAHLVMDSYPGPLGQVLTNLVSNALQHGFDGRSEGNVSIRARQSDSMEGWIELSVEDDGAGIPPANLKRIFDPFFTTKLGAGGSGLGLNITHTIVTGILGGKIRVQSKIESGTTFILTVPSVAPQWRSEEFPIKTRLALLQ